MANNQYERLNTAAITTDKDVHTPSYGFLRGRFMRWMQALSLSLLSLASPAFGDAFDLNYSGRLLEMPSGTPVSGTIEAEVHLYADATTTSELIPAKVVSSVVLVDGVFSFKLPLSLSERETVFSSPNVWINIRDKTHDRVYPRQRFSAVPYALKIPIDTATLGYDGNGYLFVKSGSVNSSFTQGVGQYVGTSEVKARDGDGLKLSNDSGEGLFVADNGKVGIGTTSPGQKLHVEDVGYTGIQAKSTGGDAGFNASSVAGFTSGYFLSQGAALEGGLYTTPTNDLEIKNYTQDKDIVLYVNDGGVNTAALTAQGITGNVGIGTTSPADRLSVDGTTGLAGFVSIRPGGSSLAGNAPLHVFSNVATSQSYGANTALKLSPWGSANEVSLKFGDWAEDPITTMLISRPGGNSTATSRLAFGNGSTEFVSLLNSNGYVGIGTTAPSTKLNVRSASEDASSSGMGRFETNVGTDDVGLKFGSLAGSGSAGYSYVQSFHTGVANDANLILNPIGGKVGMGTTSPSDMLQVGSQGAGIYAVHVKGDNTTCSAFPCLRSGGSGSIVISPQNGQFAYLNWDQGTSGGVKFGNGAGAEVMRVGADGNVGIGTTAPQSALQVVGYTQLDLTAGAPPGTDCDAAAERGRMKVDNVAGLLYICMNSGWVSK